jgi:hypothetical protein
MLPEDKEKLKELMMNYSADVFLREMADVALEVASDLSDLHEGCPPPVAKRYTQIAVSLEDIVSGRPYLV